VNDIFFLVDASPVDALRAVYISWFTAAPVYISWFTAAPVDASLFTPCGQFTLRGLLAFNLSNPSDLSNLTCV